VPSVWHVFPHFFWKSGSTARKRTSSGGGPPGFEPGPPSPSPLPPLVPEPGPPTSLAASSEEHPPTTPPERATATLAAPLLDPLGFLLRLRVELPGAGARARPQILYVLDGQALWRVTITNAGRGPAPEGIVADVPTLRLEVEAEPIRWDGVADVGERAHRSLKLWLSDDAARVPLRLEVPVGIANVVVALTDIDRRPALVR